MKWLEIYLMVQEHYHTQAEIPQYPQLAGLS